jgi:SAM-dependent methyltransferase
LDRNFFWDLDADRYVQERWTGTARARRDRDEVIQFLDSYGILGQRVLEIGCGPGYWLQHLHVRYPLVVGIDSSLRRLRVASELTDNLVGADAMRLPLAAKSFDLVIMVHVSEYASDLKVFSREARRVTRDGGWLMLITKNPSGIPWRAASALSRVFVPSPHPWQVHSVEEFAALGDWSVISTKYLSPRVITNFEDVNDAWRWRIPAHLGRPVEFLMEILPYPTRRLTSWRYASLLQAVDGIDPCVASADAPV